MFFLAVETDTRSGCGFPDFIIDSEKVSRAGTKILAIRLFKNKEFTKISRIFVFVGPSSIKYYSLLNKNM